MTNTNIEIWGRKFNLKIEYDCCEGDDILPTQVTAIENLREAKSAIFDAKEKVEAYCLSKNHYEIGADHIENIFKYVMPKYLFVRRTEAKRIVAIMCNYRFDTENGIAVVFENEKLIQVGNQDIIL